jgi:hypothetical protein
MLKAARIPATAVATYLAATSAPTVETGLENHRHGDIREREIRPKRTDAGNPRTCRSSQKNAVQYIHT